LKKKSDRLMVDIGEAQKDNNFSDISDLMRKKMEIDTKLKGL
jgi:hypothetical protein